MSMPQQDPRQLRHIEVLSAEDPHNGPEADSTVGGGGGEVGPQVEPADVSTVTDGSLAGRLRAVGEKLAESKTKDFDIPDTPLVLRARAFRDRKAFAKGLKTEVFVVRVTEGLYLRDVDTDELEAIPTWGPQLAAMLGVEASSASELVSIVMDNPVRLETFGMSLIEWMSGRAVEDEQALGE